MPKPDQEAASVQQQLRTRARLAPAAVAAGLTLALLPVGLAPVAQAAVAAPALGTTALGSAALGTSPLGASCLDLSSLDVSRVDHSRIWLDLFTDDVAEPSAPSASPSDSAAPAPSGTTSGNPTPGTSDPDSSAVVAAPPLAPLNPTEPGSGEDSGGDSSDVDGEGTLTTTLPGDVSDPDEGEDGAGEPDQVAPPVLGGFRATTALGEVLDVFGRIRLSTDAEATTFNRDEVAAAFAAGDLTIDITGPTGTVSVPASGVVEFKKVGAYQVALTFTDPASGQSAQAEGTVTVIGQRPELSARDLGGVVGRSIDLLSALSGIGSDGEPLDLAQLQADGLVTVLEVIDPHGNDVVGSVVDGQFTPQQAGPYSVQIRVRDAAGILDETRAFGVYVSALTTTPPAPQPAPELPSVVAPTDGSVGFGRTLTVNHLAPSCEPSLSLRAPDRRLIRLSGNVVDDSATWTFTPYQVGEYQWTVACVEDAAEPNEGSVLSEGTFQSIATAAAHEPVAAPTLPVWRWAPDTRPTAADAPNPNTSVPLQRGQNHPVAGIVGALYAIGGTLLATVGGAAIMQYQRSKEKAASAALGA